METLIAAGVGAMTTGVVCAYRHPEFYGHYIAPLFTFALAFLVVAVAAHTGRIDGNLVAGVAGTLLLLVWLPVLRRGHEESSEFVATEPPDPWMLASRGRTRVKTTVPRHG